MQALALFAGENALFFVLYRLLARARQIFTTYDNTLTEKVITVRQCRVWTG
ncbi:MAG: hypothetical protein HQM04_17425 [Magnetococcales bacterium]|nr:hypothetical protein [Magnetococcales bacterium]MBF0116812.1 hypothetical protein [Magnetococcales bacterium]